LKLKQVSLSIEEVKTIFELNNMEILFLTDIDLPYDEVKTIDYNNDDITIITEESDFEGIIEKIRL